MSDPCPHCGRSEPRFESTTHTVHIDGRMIAEAVNRANAMSRAIRAAAPRVRRWSWWRFTLTVR